MRDDLVGQFATYLYRYATYLPKAWNCGKHQRVSINALVGRNFLGKQSLSRAGQIVVSQGKKRHFLDMMGN